MGSSRWVFALQRGDQFAQTLLNIFWVAGLIERRPLSGLDPLVLADGLDQASAPYETPGTARAGPPHQIAVRVEPVLVSLRAGQGTATSRRLPSVACPVRP